MAKGDSVEEVKDVLEKPAENDGQGVNVVMAVPER